MSVGRHRGYRGRGMATVSQQFVSPTESDTLPAIAGLLKKRYERTIAKLYAAHGEEAAFRSAWAFIEQNISPLPDARSLVSPGLGRLAQAGLNGEHGVLQAVLLLASQQSVGMCTLSMSLKHTVFFDCQLIDVSDRVKLEVAADRVVIQTVVDGQEKTYTFERMGGTWRDVDAPEESVYIGRSVTVNLIAGVNAKTLDERVTAIFPFSQSALASIQRDLDAALGLLETHAPEYLAWIGNVLRAIVFLGPTDGSTVSHSSELRPGVIAISHPIDIPHFAAQLVHECAHQYFFLYQHEHVLTDYRSRRTYPSPLREEERPLVLSMLAVHASLNILQMIRKALAGGMKSGFFTSEVEELSEGLDRAMAGTDDSVDFTEAGAQFYGDMQRLRHDGAVA